jgi:hypothetical protein
LKESADDPFSDRFAEMIKDGGIPSRKATHSKKVGFSMHARGAGMSKRVKGTKAQVIDDSEEDVDYGNEEEGYGEEGYGEEADEMEDENILFAS